jgi:hypothetical protein
MNLQIDHLVLKVGKVVYKDYSKGGEPVVKEFKVNINEELTNVRNPQVLLALVATKAMAKTTLSTLVDFNVDLLKDPTQVPRKAMDTLKNTADTIKNAIPLPFGGGK